MTNKIIKIDCKYYLPCGRCDKTNGLCSQLDVIEELHTDNEDTPTEHGILGQPTLRFINGECDYICNPKENNK